MPLAGWAGEWAGEGGGGMTKLSLVKQKRCTLDENLKKELGHTQLLALDQHYLTFVTLEEEVAVNFAATGDNFFSPLSLPIFIPDTYYAL